MTLLFKHCGVFLFVCLLGLIENTFIKVRRILGVSQPCPHLNERMSLSLQAERVCSHPRTLMAGSTVSPLPPGPLTLPLPPSLCGITQLLLIYQSPPHSSRPRSHCLDMGCLSDFRFSILFCRWPTPFALFIVLLIISSCVFLCFTSSFILNISWDQGVFLVPSLGLVAQGTVKAPMSCLHSRSMSTGSYSSHEEDGGQAQAPAQWQDQVQSPSVAASSWNWVRQNWRILMTEKILARVCKWAGDIFRVYCRKIKFSLMWKVNSEHVLKIKGFLWLPRP